MAKIAAERAVDMLRDVDASVVPFFREAAEKFLEESSSPVEALAYALAKITGWVSVRTAAALGCCRGLRG